MKWNFKTSDVVSGKVHYDLYSFVSDLKNEVKFNFGDISAKEKERVWRLFYRLMCFSVVGTGKEKILELFKMSDDCFGAIMVMNKENVEMLRAIHMSMFLKNLKLSNLIINDQDNLSLINDVLRRFHLRNNL